MGDTKKWVDMASQEGTLEKPRSAKIQNLLGCLIFCGILASCSNENSDRIEPKDRIARVIECGFNHDGDDPTASAFISQVFGSEFIIAEIDYVSDSGASMHHYEMFKDPIDQGSWGDTGDRIFLDQDLGDYPGWGVDSHTNSLILQDKELGTEYTYYNELQSIGKVTYRLAINRDSLSGTMTFNERLELLETELNFEAEVICSSGGREEAERRLAEKDERFEREQEERRRQASERGI